MRKLGVKKVFKTFRDMFKINLLVDRVGTFGSEFELEENK